jgi:nucleotide-binding universal stress UspA family protein
MYDRILVAIDASPDSPDDALNRTAQFAKMSGGTVHLLHVARGHIIPTDISAGSGLGVRRGRRRPDRRAAIVQAAVDFLAAQGIDVHGELVEAAEHDAADAIVQRANELDGDLLEIEADHRRHAVVEQSIAELKSAGLAHLPSGGFMANAAWLALAVTAHNLGRAVGALTGMGRATAATLRRRLFWPTARPPAANPPPRRRPSPAGRDADLSVVSNRSKPRGLRLDLDEEVDTNEHSSGWCARPGRDHRRSRLGPPQARKGDVPAPSRSTLPVLFARARRSGGADVREQSCRGAASPGRAAGATV